MAIGDTIARLSVFLNLETAAFEKGARNASGQVNRMQQAMGKAATAIGGAFAGISFGAAIQQFRDMGKAAFESAKGIQNAAQVANAGVEEFQKAAYAAKSVGIESEKLADIYKDVNDKVGDFMATGGGEMADFFEKVAPKVGVTAEQFAKLSGPQALQLYMSSLEKAGLSQQQMTFYMESIADEATALIPLLKDGGAAFDAYAREAEKFGIVMSPAEIAKAKELAGAMGLLNARIEAQQNKKLLENADALIAYEEAVGAMNIGLVQAVGELHNFGVAFEQNRLKNGAITKSFVAGFTQFTEGANKLARDIGSALSSAHAYVIRFVSLGRDLVQGLANGIRNSASAVWNALGGVVTSGIARAKSLLGIQSPSRVFMEIGDYIGEGLAIGIEGGKGKVAEATRKLTEAARRAAEETKALFARLFPELDAANTYRADLALIAGAGISEDAKTNARIRLGREFTGTDGEIPIRALNDNEALDVTKGLDVVLAKLDTFGSKAGAVTVQVAKSFKDMADATIQSLSNLANSIKGGGFLDILSAVIGLGMQLGSIGAFGKKIQANINAPKVPGYANGTNFHPGGLAIVGERRAELVEMPRGSRVHPNLDALSGGKLQVSVAVENGNLRAFVRNESGQLIAESAPAMMDGAAQVAQSRFAYEESRRVA